MIDETNLLFTNLALNFDFCIFAEKKRFYFSFNQIDKKK